MRVDFPRPDSPEKGQPRILQFRSRNSKNAIKATRTNDHGRELETLPDALPVDLVWEVRETDVAHQLFADDGRDRGMGRRGDTIRAAVDGGKVAVGSTGVAV